MYKSYKTLFQRRGGGEGDEISPILVFVFLRQSEINLYCLNSTDLALQDDTSYADNDCCYCETEHLTVAILNSNVCTLLHRNI